MTRDDAIFERALEELENEGAFPPTRNEFLLGASVALESLLVASKGASLQTIDDYLQSGAATIYRKERVPEDERKKRDGERTRNFFDALYNLVNGDKQ